ncbi:MAG: hypothetical protein WA064_01335 [Candidatus Moraniibacteriota bacterium]
MSKEGKVLEFKRPVKKLSEAEMIEASMATSYGDEEIDAIEKEQLEIDEQWGGLRKKIAELNLKFAGKKLKLVSSESVDQIEQRNGLMGELNSCEERMRRLIGRTESKLALEKERQDSHRQKYLYLAKGQEKEMKIEAKEKYGSELRGFSSNIGNLDAILVSLRHMRMIIQKLKKEFF